MTFKSLSLTQVFKIQSGQKDIIVKAKSIFQ